MLREAVLPAYYCGVVLPSGITLWIVGSWPAVLAWVVVNFGVIFLWMDRRGRKPWEDHPGAEVWERGEKRFIEGVKERRKKR